MSELFRRQEISKREGRDWLKQSLTGGQTLSAAALSALSLGDGRFHTFIPANARPGQIKFPEHGFVGEAVGNAGLSQALDDLARAGGSCVVVEDDILERTDRKPDDMTVPSAFIDDGVVHWCDLDPRSGAAATEAIRESAFGYPLNAFVTTQSASDLRLVDNQPVAMGFIDQVAGSLLAIVVSAFDGESFMLWDRP